MPTTGYHLADYHSVEKMGLDPIDLSSMDRILMSELGRRVRRQYRTKRSIERYPVERGFHGRSDSGQKYRDSIWKKGSKAIWGSGWLYLFEFWKKEFEEFFLEFGELPIADNKYLKGLIVNDLHRISDDTLGDIIVKKSKRLWDHSDLSHRIRSLFIDLILIGDELAIYMLSFSFFLVYIRKTNTAITPLARAIPIDRGIHREIIDTLFMKRSNGISSTTVFKHPFSDFLLFGLECLYDDIETGLETREYLFEVFGIIGSIECPLAREKTGHETTILKEWEPPIYIRTMHISMASDIWWIAVTIFEESEIYLDRWLTESDSFEGFVYFHIL
jgi:hypothetical protein